MEKFLERRNKIRRTVAKQKLDALLITNPINVRYLTGFTGGSAYLLIQPGGDIILSDPRFTIQIEEECLGLEAVIRPRSISASKTLSKLLEGGFIKRLGFEAETVTLGQFDRLFQYIPPNWRPTSTKNIVEELRQVKDKDEIAQIRRAVDIATRAFQYVCGQLRPSLSEIDIRNMLENQMMILGAEDKSFSTIIAAGSRSALPHAVPTAQTLSRLPILLFDWGCVVNGYMSDMTRALIFAPNNKKLRTVYETVLTAQEAAIAAIKPGKTCEEIDTVARNIITKAGFGRKFGHGLGHSIGLQIHEDPRFTSENQTVLKVGMVLTVEPGIYLKGWGGIRIEDVVLVTKSGCEVLSKKLPKAFDDVVMTYSSQ
jgi:Xaa-Pro aminopeptidase